MINKNNLLGLVILSAGLAGCASTENQGSEPDTYGEQIGKQTEKMSKNIGTSGLRRGMNKGGNSLFKKLGL